MPEVCLLSNSDVAAVERDARLPCACWDCDGAWCAWCHEHHGGKACPFVVGVKAEQDLLRQLLGGGFVEALLLGGA